MLFRNIGTICPFRITRSIDSLKNDDKINWLVDSFLREAKTRKVISSFIFLFIRYDWSQKYTRHFKEKHLVKILMTVNI